ncbi:MAG: carbohydrate kinase family protein [Duncaniella sp.]|nr:carbohydrate kinase family protein [Duncaniella sp.]
MSKRLYFMGGLSLKVMLQPAGDASWTLDDLMANAAIAAATHRDTAFIGRASADITGSLATDILVKAGIDTAGLDRYSDVPLPLTLASGDSETICTIPSAEAFNPVWPRFEAGDVMVWGGYFSLDPTVHTMMLDLLRYASARKVTMVYVPYFNRLQVPRVTRVMPLIFDNLELADTVIATTDIIETIFGNADMGAVYNNNISFYAPRFFAIDNKKGTLEEHIKGEAVTRPAAMDTAEVIASIVISL